VEEGQIVTLIGANGAGKSTALRTIVGLVKLGRGPSGSTARISPGSRPMRSSARHRHQPGGRRVFSNLTILENLELGAYIRDQKTFDTQLEWVYSLFPGCGSGGSNWPGP